MTALSSTPFSEAALSEIRSLVNGSEEPPEPAINESAVRDALSALRIPGVDAETAEIQPLGALPTMTNPDFQNVGYSGFEQRLRLDSLPDDEKIRFASAAANGNPAMVNQYVDALRRQSITRDRKSLSFPQDDAEQIARDLGMSDNTIRSVEPHIRNMLARPEGAEKLRSMWSDGMVSRLVGRNNRIYQAMAARALAGDDAVAFADWERGLDDAYGGWLTAGNNVAHDFAYAAGRTGASMGLGLLQSLSDAGYVLSGDSQATRAAGLDALLNHPLLGEDMRRGYAESLGDYHGYGVTPPDWQTPSDQVTEIRNEANRYFYRARSEGVLSGALQPLVEGLGSTITSIAAWLVSPAAGIASSWGAGYSEVSDAMPDADINTRFMVGSFGALLYTALDYMSFDTLMKGWGAFSPGGKWLRDSIGKPALGEFANEGGQSGVADIGAEINASLDPDYEFSGSKFAARAIPNFFTNGIVGLVTGGVMGGAGSGMTSVYARDRLWRLGQKTIDDGVAKLKNAGIFRSNPSKAKELLESAIEAKKAPRSMYMNADEVRVKFQNRPAALETFLADGDVTMDEYNHALVAGSEIEVSTAGLIRHQARPDADPDLQKIASPTPDAPNLGAIAEREEDKAEIVREYERIQRSSETLPEPFAIFRQQAADATGDSAYAQDVTDILLALSRVAAKRLGITPEQFLNMRPIQTLLENGLRRARSAGEVVADAEGIQLERSTATAQAAYSKNQEENKGARNYVRTSSGNIDFGLVTEDMTTSKEAIKVGFVPAPVRLEEVGERYGRTHIRVNHFKDLLKAMGVAEADSDTVSPTMIEDFVEQVAQNAIAVYHQEKNGRFAMVSRDAHNNFVVLELMKDEEEGEQFYSVITGFKRHLKAKIKGTLVWERRTTPSSNSGDPTRLHMDNPQGQKASNDGLDGQTSDNQFTAMPGDVIWDGSVARQQDSGDPVRIPYRYPQESGEDAALRNSGQITSPISTIPVDSTNVNQWIEDSLDAIMEKAGIVPEQADALRRYVKSVLQAGGDAQTDAALVQANIIDASEAREKIAATKGSGYLEEATPPDDPEDEDETESGGENSLPEEAARDEFKEEDHPRRKDGVFGNGGGSKRKSAAASRQKERSEEIRNGERYPNGDPVSPERMAARKNALKYLGNDVYGGKRTSAATDALDDKIAAVCNTTRKYELKSPEGRAISYYVTASRSTNEKARKLRGAKTDDPIIAGLDRAIDDAKPLEDDIEVYRRVTVEQAGMASIINYGFTSTALDRKAAESFKEKSGQEVIKIILPKGTKGLYVPGSLTDAPSETTESVFSMDLMQREQEYLLPRGSKMSKVRGRLFRLIPGDQK